jgi:hypothetical protein
MLQILVFHSIILVKRENALNLQDSWNDLQFGMEGVSLYYFNKSFNDFRNLLKN